MEGGKHEVTGQGRLDADLRRFEVADLADEDDVRVLPEEGSQRGGEGQADLFVHLDLVHAGQVELDGVFGGGNVPVDLVQLRQGRVQRRGLARSGGTRHEDHPPGLVDGLLESGEGFLFEAELGHVELQGRLVQDSQNHLFAEQGWEHGYPELHLLAALDPELDPAVLGEPPLGDVEPGHDLQA